MVNPIPMKRVVLEGGETFLRIEDLKTMFLTQGMLIRDLDAEGKIRTHDERMVVEGMVEGLNMAVTLLDQYELSAQERAAIADNSPEHSNALRKDTLDEQGNQ